MRLAEGFWAFVTTIFHVGTLSPVQNANFDQSPLPLQPPPPPPAVVEEAASKTVDVVPNGIAAVTTSLGAGPTFRPPGSPKDEGFQCEYPKMVGWESCSTPYDRSCWLRNKVDGRRYDLFTNYEKDMPIGITRRYHFNLTEGTYSADGWPFSAGKFFNSTYPGPWLQACWGDTLEVTVTNHLPHNGTSVHWHGIRQNQTMHMDGVNGITQCPIAPDDYFVYKFNITQYGSSWYHSHYSVQYADGAVGALTLHGPTSAEFDEAISPPLIMTDWTHNSAFDAVSTRKFVEQSILLNGKGNVTKTRGTKNQTEILPPLEVIFEQPTIGRRVKRYLLRLINTSFDTTFIFSIDNHMLQIVSADFVPIFPYANTSVLIGIGQRYNVIVEANPVAYDNNNVIEEKDNYWIRTYVAEGCGDVPTGQNYSQMGILRYSNESKADPTTISWDDFEGISKECSDEPYGSLHPVLPWNIKKPANGGQIGQKLDLYVGNERDKKKPYPLAAWSLNNYAEGADPMRINYSDPIFLHLDQNPSTSPFVSSWRVVPEDYTSEDWIFLAIEAPKESAFMAHPIHLHGHDFALVEQSYDKLLDPWHLSLKLDNPPRRDVVLLPKGGYVIIAFKADNPGAWLIHCHIAFHISEGLGLQVMERQQDANAIWPKGDSKALDEANRVCRNWTKWQQDEHHWDPIMLQNCNQKGADREFCFQDDSGV